MPCVFPFTYSDGKYPDGSARPWVSHYQCTKRNLKVASGWQSAFWCATKVNADGYYEAYDDCNDDCPNPETNIKYSYESSQIYWTYEKESKTIRNQKCKYVVCTYGQTKSAEVKNSRVILRIVLPLLAKALYEFGFFEGIL